MSTNPTASRHNQFRRFNESAATSQQERKKLRCATGNGKATDNSLAAASHCSSLLALDHSVLSLPFAAAACDSFSTGNVMDLTSFLPAAGTAAAATTTTTTTTTTTAGLLPSLAYSGLAATSPRNYVLGRSNPWPALHQFTSFSTPQFLINSSLSIPFMPTSRELTFQMEALHRLQKAIDLIPMMDKIDFLAALQVAPDLVSKESDYLRFLRHANFDAKAAADKLVSYWKCRRSLFGDRAFRPMDMTGNGAMSLEDIESLKSGNLAYAHKDSEGCPVVIINPSRRQADTTAQSRMRVAFYHAQCLSEDCKAQTEGFVILCMVSVNRYDRTSVDSASLLINTFPMKVKAWHTFDCIKDQNSLEQGFLYGFMEVFLHSLNKVTTSLYSAEAMEDIVWELATEHGISIESIPDCLGGTWTYDMFQLWLVERMSYEKDHYSPFPLDQSMSSSVISRQNHLSPRPCKRSKWDQEEEKSLKGDAAAAAAAADVKLHAEKPLVVDSSYDSESIEGLLAEFQKLLLHTDTDSSQETSAAAAEALHLRLPQPPKRRPFPDHLLHSYYNGDHYGALEKALHAISVHDKVDYMTAIHIAPELVLQESDPARFLSFHNYDAEKAAQGMVRYWKQRHELFGDRAFLPMTLTGNGALNAQDIEFQTCGNLAITGQDQYGSSVLVFDPSRRTTDDRNVRMRNMFYMWQILFDNPVNQDLGFITIHIIRNPDYDKVIIEGLPMALSLFPIKLKALHTFDLMNQIDLFRRGFVQGLMGIIVSAYTTATATFFHSNRRLCAENNMCVLETQHGLPRSVIPVCIGGSWNYDVFEKFQKERILLEQDRYSTAVVNCGTTSSTIPSQTHFGQGAVAGSTTIVPEQIVRGDGHAINDGKLPPRLFPQPGHQEVTVVSSRENNPLLLLDGEACRLPAKDTAEYFEAKTNAPQKIWQEECSPELFLRVEDYDVRKAAARLAKYWRLRSHILGTSQYDSLTQTGDDALGRKELSTLGTGFLNLLPYDIHGRSVLFLDPTLLPNNIDDNGKCQNACHRCLFYMMSLMTENDKSQSNGAILILRIDPQHVDLVDAPLLVALSKALPLKISEIHLISQENVSTTDLMRKTLESLNTTVHVHSHPSKDLLLSKLVSFGLTKAGLPKFVKGDWGLAKFFHWQELRTRIEWQIPTCLSGRDHGLTSSFPAMKAYTLLSEDEHDHDAAAAERKRRMSLIHFRRKQTRSRVIVLMLEESCDDLRQEKSRLLQENEELEEKYAKATLIVSNLAALQ